MADIRSSGMLDTFDRADEYPIKYPWENPFPGEYGDMHLWNNSVSGTTLPPQGNACWRPDVAASGDVEIWAIAGGSAAIPDSYRIGLFSRDQAVDGYQCLAFAGIGGSSWDIRVYTGGSYVGIQSVDYAMPSSGSLVLLRTYGGQVQSWLSNDNGTTWAMVNNVADPTYRSNLHPMLGITTGFGGGSYEITWAGVGFGRINRPQIYRWIPT